MVRATELIDNQSHDKTFYWSRMPGKFVHKHAGTELKSPISFSGNIMQWYEILGEIIHEASEQLSYGKATHVVAPPDVLTMIESSPLYRPHLPSKNIVEEENKFFEDSTFAGVLRNRWDIYKCMDLPMDTLILVNENDPVAEQQFVKILDMSLL